MRCLVVVAMTIILSSGCGSGFLSQRTKIDKLYPSPGAKNVPLDVIVSFRVFPANAWVDINIVFTDQWGRERYLYFKLWKEEETFWNQARYYVQFYELLLPNTEYRIWIRASHYDYGDKVIPGHHWKFKTGSQTSQTEF